MLINGHVNPSEGKKTALEKQHFVSEDILEKSIKKKHIIYSILEQLFNSSFNGDGDRDGSFLECRLIILIVFIQHCGWQTMVCNRVLYKLKI